MQSAYGHLSGALSTLLEGNKLWGRMLKALSWLRHSAPRPRLACHSLALRRGYVLLRSHALGRVHASGAQRIRCH